MAAKIICFAGSLRSGSFNKKLLAIAVEKARQLGADAEVIDLAEIPFYDGDLESLGLPEPVKLIRQKILATDGVIIATPEYNHSFSGVLKNAIDWLSRPPNSLKGKFAIILGASTGYFGTVRAQTALRPVLAALDVFVIPFPQVFVPAAEQAFDEKGRPKSADFEKQLGELVARLLKAIEKQKA